MPKINSLTLVRAISTGWGRTKDLNAPEQQMLLFVATKGALKEPGSAFTWYPIKGMDYWAYEMGMPRTTFQRTKRTLAAKGLLVPQEGRSTQDRYYAIQGYCIPHEVMYECDEWVSNGQRRVSEVGQTDVPEVEPESPEVEHDCSRSGANLAPEVGHSGSRSGISAPPLTREFPVHKQGITKEREQIAYASSGGTAAAGGTLTKMTTTDDDWARPKDDDWDDFAAPKPERVAKREAPSTRLAKHFHLGWQRAREKRPMLPLAWSAKPAFLRSMNLLLKDFSVQQIEQMMDVFWRMVVDGKFPVRSDQMWKDFLSHKAECWAVVSRTSEPSASDDYLDRLMEESIKRHLGDG